MIASETQCTRQEADDLSAWLKIVGQGVCGATFRVEEKDKALFKRISERVDRPRAETEQRLDPLYAQPEPQTIDTKGPNSPVSGESKA